ncbi:MAG TPA: carbohydrate porin, partial [Vicinamibacterales bacterium]|nr:carbohydrate porin [Vicinamibacterales bacterium]
MLLLLGLPSGARSQEASPAPEPPATTTLLPHGDDQRWWLSAQVNLIGQAHGEFDSPYEGEHSLRAIDERALSRLWTVFAGVQLPHHADVLVAIESAGGHGISDALGLAGFTNLDVVRNPDLGATPYLARAMIHVSIPLTSETASASRGPFTLAPTVPVRRLDIRAGKLGIVDFFDVNAVGSDSHLQFTNWAVDNNGAYDYAADTRGYTYGLIVEYITPRWSIRGAEALMPTVANGIDLDWHLAQSRGENVEVELHEWPRLVLRLVGYANHANMGSYEEAIDAFHSGLDPVPDIEAHRRAGRVKYGVGANAEYSLGGGVRLFGRTGWNSGDTESFAYTEVNDTAAFGGDISGGRWHRSADRVGAAFVSNGLSSVHREYLRLGGLGFLLGDGNLRYGRETIVESYYTAHVWRGVFGSGGGTFIANP